MFWRCSLNFVGMFNDGWLIRALRFFFFFRSWRGRFDLYAWPRRGYVNWLYTSGPLTNRYSIKSGRLNKHILPDNLKFIVSVVCLYPTGVLAWKRE